MKSTLENVLLKHQSTFSKVVEFNATADQLFPVDFTAANKELTDELITDTQKFSEYITYKLQSNNCKYGIGGYNELREMYKRSALFSFTKDTDPLSAQKHAVVTAEPRRLHLGIDIWGAADTKVFAPLGGMVHSFANNNNFGDYGATIILQHQIDTVVFYTLYGHLALKDIVHLKTGRFFTRGQCIAHFGNSLENGNWPPHLHFQIIEDIERKEGDYPGVCKVSEKEKYLRNCPNADLILNLMQYVKQ
jgi:peptidoglycan LD-endopeptidase LytH